MIGDTMQHVIIAGFGPVGRVLADTLQKENVPFIIIEMNEATVRSQRSLGRSIVQGDATNSDVLKAAGILDASAVVITIPDPQTATRICQSARALSSSALIAIRTRHLSEANLAKQLGADITVVEEIETARAMAMVVTAALKPGDQATRAGVVGNADRDSGVRSAKSHSEPARRCTSRQQSVGRHSMIPNHGGICYAKRTH
jgi:CPA2 family monovalent cation:H+ antiporter-2